MSGEVLNSATVQLEEKMYERRQRETEALRDRNSVLLNRRLASMNAYYSNRLERAQEARDAATNERIKRMRESQVKRTAQELIAKQQELEARRVADIVPHRLAVGVLEVRLGE